MSQRELCRSRISVQRCQWLHRANRSREELNVRTQLDFLPASCCRNIRKWMYARYGRTDCAQKVLQIRKSPVRTQKLNARPRCRCVRTSRYARFQRTRRQRQTEANIGKHFHSLASTSPLKQRFKIQRYMGKVQSRKNPWQGQGCHQ